MDRSQRSVQEYLSAARREPGISEQEVRAIVDAGWERRAHAVPRRPWWRSILPWGAAALIVGGGATAVVMNDSATPVTVAQKRPAATSIERSRLIPQMPSKSAEPVAPKATVETAKPAAAVASAVPPTLRIPRSRFRSPGTERRSAPYTDVDNNSTTTTITDQEDSMNISSLKKLAGTAIVAATVVSAVNAFPPAAPAQKTTVTINHETSPIMEKFEQEIGMAAYDYWIARLNDYKRTIDRALSPADLARLNKLRVRFAMMISEAKVNSNVTVTPMDGEKKKKQGTFSMDMSDEDGFAKVQEFMMIYMEAKGLADQYDSELKPLGEGVVGDFFTFTDQMSSRVESFVAENRTAIAADRQAASLLDSKEEARTFIADLGSEEGREGIRQVYDEVIEPIIMLYDGAELSLLLAQAAPFTKGVTGLTLPDASVLSQSTPNPASGSVSIGYNLKEQSDRTLLRIFNSTGSLVGTFEQGSRPAGSHNVVVDVSGYPAGKYLYHLTIQTSKGEQVYSKSMQVVR